MLVHMPVYILMALSFDRFFKQLAASKLSASPFCCFSMSRKLAVENTHHEIKLKLPAGIQSQRLSRTGMELGVKTQQELKLARDVKENKKGFHQEGYGKSEAARHSSKRT